ncbi:C40 family peptidase [Candidatus Pacearchaeota archaeon]|nr:C40 family peptidase [Candidatus Pacearchaeota archaeon]
MQEYFDCPENKFAFQKILLSWVGTPYRHATAVRGRGADCALFLAACLKELGVIENYSKKFYSKDWHIHGKEQVFLRHWKEHVKALRPGLSVEKITGEHKFGDWLIFIISKKEVANHSAVYLGDGKIIHAVEKIGVKIDELNSWKRHLWKSYRLYTI